MSGTIARRWLRAIAARPDDDAPRLVWADHLVDRGDPRGALIHVQCALARGITTGALRAQQRALLRAHEGRWLSELGLQADEGEFRRGLVEKLSISPARMEAAVGSLHEAVAIVRHLRLRLAPDEREHQPFLRFDDGVLDHVEVLEVDMSLDATTAEALLQSRLMRRVRVISLRGRSLPAELRSRLWDLDLQAESMDLSHHQLGDDGCRALAHARWLGTISRLSLASTELDDDGLLTICRAQRPRRLQHLDVSGCRLERPDSVGEAMELAALSELHCSANTLQFHALPTVKRTRLSRLNMSLNAIDDRGAGILAGWEALRSVASLSLWGNPLGNAGVDALRLRFGERVHLGDMGAVTGRLNGK